MTPGSLRWEFLGHAGVMGWSARLSSALAAHDRRELGASVDFLK